MSDRVIRVCAIFTFLLFSVTVRAQGPIVSIGTAFGEEESADGHSYDSYVPLILRAGYAFEIYQIPLDAYVEYQMFEISDGNGLLTVDTLHQEASFWLRYRFLQYFRTQPYIAAGMGGSSDLIRTQFNGEVTSATQNPELLLGFATGLSFAIYRGLESQLEARLSSANSFEPNPLLQIGVHLGYRF